MIKELYPAISCIHNVAALSAVLVGLVPCSFSFVAMSFSKFLQRHDCRWTVWRQHRYDNGLYVYDLEI